jgi:hypothetical protein
LNQNSRIILMIWQIKLKEKLICILVWCPEYRIKIKNSNNNKIMI